jgi:hypothetical protein
LLLPKSLINIYSTRLLGTSLVIEKISMVDKNLDLSAMLWSAVLPRITQSIKNRRHNLPHHSGNVKSDCNTLHVFISTAL